VASAEPLDAEMRATIARVFRAPVFNRYGANELGDVGCECAEHSGLHLSPLTHHVEVLRGDGQPCEPGEVGRIVVTPLFNRTMPLIRYDIGDRGAWEPSSCACGRSLPALREISGRVVDSFVRADGSVVDALYIQACCRLPQWIERFQVIQLSPTQVHVKVVDEHRAADPPMTRTPDLAAVSAHIRRAMGDGCEVSFEFVDDIPRSASGKYRLTLSQMAHTRTEGREITARHSPLNSS
jgi:phenylacetate-CoA ligase